MNVTLRPELEKLIDDEVKSGRSTDPNEFINRAVYHYVVARELGEEYTPEEIDRQGTALDSCSLFRLYDFEEQFSILSFAAASYFPSQNRHF